MQEGDEGKEPTAAGGEGRRETAPAPKGSCLGPALCTPKNPVVTSEMMMMDGGRCASLPGLCGNRLSSAIDELFPFTGGETEAGAACQRGR